jgi:hypothetical protein
MIKQIEVVDLLLAWAGLFGILSLLIFVPLTKTVLGGVVAIVGAFFPNNGINKITGNAKIKLKNIEITFGGSIRAAVIVCGIVILVFSGVETYGSIAEEKNRIAANGGSADSTLNSEAEQYTKFFENLQHTNERISNITYYLESMKVNLLRAANFPRFY